MRSSRQPKLQNRSLGIDCIIHIERFNALGLEPSRDSCQPLASAEYDQSLPCVLNGYLRAKLSSCGQ